MVEQNNKPLENQVRQKHLSRLYFLSKGCKQVPLELTGGKVLWANPDEGYFMSGRGSKIKPSHSPAKQRRNVKGRTKTRGLEYPKLRYFSNKTAHRIMFTTFADEPCPIFFDSKSNPYKGVVHHVIENPNDVRMSNLMGWLTYKQHKVADKRRRALEAVLPDMYCVETFYLKTLQDPRQTDDVFFEMELNKLRATYAKDNL
jgi:hypothetical protein